MIVTLTDKGSSVFENAIEALKSHNKQALSRFSEPELRTLRSLLQRVLMNIVQEPTQFQRVLTFER